MHPRRSPGRARDQLCARPGRIAVAVIVLALAAGCGKTGTSGGHPAAGSTSAGTKVAACGTTKSAANVPVNVEVARGHVPCRTAMTIEQDYANAIRSGRAPGNGGGGPIDVRGWTCEGFATPIVLNTGKASKCVEGGNEILAILPASA